MRGYIAIVVVVVIDDVNSVVDATAIVPSVIAAVIIKSPSCSQIDVVAPFSDIDEKAEQAGVSPVCGAAIHVTSAISDESVEVTVDAVTIAVAAADVVDVLSR